MPIDLLMWKTYYRLKLKDIEEMLFEQCGKHYHLCTISVALNDKCVADYEKECRSQIISLVMKGKGAKNEKREKNGKADEAEKENR